MSAGYLITGATGIAAATARRATAEGARVFIVSRGEGEVRALAAELGGAGDGAVAELTDAAAVEAAVERAASFLGRIDGVFNVAGISGRRFGDGPIHECTEEGWDTVLDANARSVFLVCRATVRRMLEQPLDEHGLRGAILNMASVLAVSPQADYFSTHAYAASKGAILALSRSMAAYYAARRIRVNALAPALVRTPMSRRAQEDPEILALMKTKQPLTGDLIDAEEIAKAALFLLNPATSAAVTGDTLTLDAGWSVSG